MKKVLAEAAVGRQSVRSVAGTLEAVPDGAGGAVLRLLGEDGKIIVTIGVPAPGKREVKYWNSVAWGKEAWAAVERAMGKKGG